jgi:DNA-directed RNA polymerase alpha subunit
VRELVTFSEDELSKMKGCGAKTMHEIKEALAQMDLTMNTVFDKQGANCVTRPQVN